MNFLLEHHLETCSGVTSLPAQAAKLKKTRVIHPAFILVPLLVLAVAGILTTNLMDQMQPSRSETFMIALDSVVGTISWPFERGRRGVEYLNITIPS